MTGFEWFLLVMAFAALFLAHLNGRDWGKTIEAWKESNEGWGRTIDMAREWKSKATSFHRRSQSYESQCCRLRRDLVGAHARAEWWRSEAKRLGWTPTERTES